MQLELAAGQAIDGARHLCGMRRSGLAAPGLRAACGHADVVHLLARRQGSRDRRNRPRPLARGLGFFVCPACAADLSGYFTRPLENGAVEVLYRGPPRRPFEKMVAPYPVCPLSLRPRPMAGRPKGLETQVRVEKSGSYHLLSSHLR